MGKIIDAEMLPRNAVYKINVQPTVVYSKVNNYL